MICGLQAKAEVHRLKVTKVVTPEGNGIVWFHMMIFHTGFWYFMILVSMSWASYYGTIYFGKNPQVQWVSEKRISSRSQQVCHWIAARRPSTKHWDKGWKLSSETAGLLSMTSLCFLNSWNKIQEFQTRLPECPPRNSISYREDCNQSFVFSKRDMVLHRAQNSFAASASNSPSTILSAFRKSCCASWSFSKASRIWLASTCLPFIVGESVCAPRIGMNGGFYVCFPEIGLEMFGDYLKNIASYCVNLRSYLKLLWNYSKNISNI